jgi:hypothetical protein
MAANNKNGGGGGGNRAVKRNDMPQAQETTRLLLDSVRIAHETEVIGE